MRKPPSEPTEARRDWLSGSMRVIAATLSAGGALVSILNYTNAPRDTADDSAGVAVRARRVAVQPALDTLTAVGDSAQLAVLVTDERGAALVGVAPSWSSSEPAVAEVDSGGTVVARGPGMAIILVRVGSVEGRARVLVRQRPAAIRLADTLVVVREGEHLRVTARVEDARGQPVAGAEPAWTSAEPAVAAVDPQGELEAKIPGRTTLAVSLGQLQASMAVEVTPVPASITVLAGDGQRAAAGATLPATLAAQVVSRTGRPIPGVSVAFQVEAGTAAPGIDTSDVQGMVHARWTLGEVPGRQRLRIAVDGLGMTPTLTAEADPVRANARLVTLNESLAGIAGDSLAEPVAVRLTDSVGRALADVPIRWSTPERGVVVPAESRTDSLGEARVVWRLGPRSGRQRLRIQPGNARTMPAVIVTADARPGAAVAVAVRSGEEQRGVVARPLARALVLAALDRGGNPVPGVRLKLASGTGTVTDSTPTTDSTGLARLTWTLGRAAGAQHLVLRLATDTGSIELSARAAPADPAALRFVSPPATGVSGRAAEPIVFEVTDRYGNPVSGRTIALRPSSGTVAPAKVATDARGRATIRWVLGKKSGLATVVATVPSTNLKATLSLKVRPRP